MEQENLKFDQSLQKINILFYLSGMNLNHKIITISDTIKHRWFFVFNFLTLVLVLSLASSYVIIGIANKRNFLEVASLLPCMSITVLDIFKSFNHLFKEGKISDLNELIRNLERDANQREASLERSKIVNEDFTFLNRVINVLIVTVFLTMIVFNAMPLIMMAMEYFKGNEVKLLLQYCDIFAYTPYETKYWVLAFIHQFWAEYIVLLELGAADYLLFTCSFYIRTQLRLLHHDIETIIPDSEEVMPVKEFQSKFSKLVIRHQKIIEAAERLEEIYSSSLLINFIASSLVICLTGFTLSVVHDVVVVGKYISFLIMGLAQVFFLCWFADMMTSASADISNAVYNSLWYRYRVSGSKALLVMQTRAQQPCVLTAAGFAVVDLNSFLRVLSTSWSYFTLLQTVYGSSDT